MKKRFSAPRTKYGEIKVQWGKLAGEDEDHCLVWGGHPGAKRDAKRLMYAIDSKVYSPVSEKWDDSLIEDLEKRGYDLTTLKISVSKKI